MNTRTLILLASVIAVFSLSLTGCKPAAKEEEEKKAPTEVAVRVGKIVRTTLRRYVEGWGTVEPEPAYNGHAAASARVASPVAGVVMEVKCAEGQRVEKGATLFQLDARLANVQLEKAKQAADFAEVTYARQKKLMENQGTSLKQLQEAEQQLRTARTELTAAQTQCDLLRVTAPLSGTIARVAINPGEAVELLTVMAEIVDLDRLVVSANVPSAELPLLKLGLPVELRMDKADEKPVGTGTICFIAPQVDPKTGSVLVRASVPPNAGLRPGQFVRVRIICEERANRLAVPRASIYTDHDGQSTVSVVEGDVAKQKVVKVGLRDGELIEVEGEGLAEGMTVVTEGSYALPKETKIRVLEH